MDIVELLQEVGLTRYEAEAYTTLLREGPLTGYELGKRSKVPLPRIYDVLARLQTRGLVLVQPGDPARYLAEDSARFLAQMRRRLSAQLDELEAQFRTISPRTGAEEFWVIRGHDQIRERIIAMIEGAERGVVLRLPAALGREIADVTATQRQRGLRLTALNGPVGLSGDDALVLADQRELLAGTAGDSGQVVVTANRALVAVVRARLGGESRDHATPGAGPAATGTDWVAWEDDKHRRLRLLMGRNDVA